jgi:ELWxxDGT repeat protein
MSTLRLVSDIWPGPAGSFPDKLTAVGSTLFFTANDGISGYELWKSDGTSSGTTRVADIYPGIPSSNARNLTATSNTLYFVAGDGRNGRELWKTDGTSAGTNLVSDIRLNSDGSYPYNLIIVGDSLFFRALDDSSGFELWTSDGTSDGTKRLADINPGSPDSNPQLFASAGNNLYFTASDGNTGYELWRHSLTDNFTTLVADIYPGGRSSYPRALTGVGSSLFFTANDGSTGYELWKSDGTTSDVTRVADIYPGKISSYPKNFIGIGSTLFFTADTRGNGRELWKTDGTSSGTILVSDIFPGSNGSEPSNLTVVGNTLFFTAYDDSRGLELWKTNGTSAGTVLVADIRLGSDGSYPSNLTIVGDALYFTANSYTANDGSRGFELWKSESISGDTLRVADINLSSTSSTPQNLTVVGNTLFFTMSDGSSGRELWAWDLSSIPPTPVNDGKASFSISGTPVVGQTLAAAKTADDPDGNGTFSHIWQSSANGSTWTAIGTGSSLTIAKAQEGQQINLLTTYTDGQGFNESLTATPVAIPFVNDGKASFSISGTPAVGQTLSAAQTADDPDGNGTFSHAWQALTNGTTWKTIATGGALTVSRAQKGQQIRLLTSYIDDQGFSESVTAPAVSIPFINDGKASFSISGTPAVGQRLTATITANDPDGDGNSTFSNTWQASVNGINWSTVSTGAALTVAKAQEGQQIRLLTSYIDDQGFSESVTAPAVSIPFINDGSAVFSISGNTTVGQRLTATITASDPDGTGNSTFFNTWQVSAQGITWSTIATGPALTVAKAQQGQQIRLLTSYVDDQGFSESMVTTPVAIPLSLLPTLAIAAADADQPEGNLGITPFSFTVSRSGDSSSASSVQWAVGNTGINTADARDFAGNRLPSGTVRFQPGMTSQSITVNVRADLEQELDESFTVSLSEATGATITTAAAVGTIRNDDLIGTAGADTIRGSNRADFIDGRAGQDLLTGGPGPDLFGFRYRQSTITAPDRITDFRFGEDRIAIFNPNGTPRPLPGSFTRAADNRTATTLSELAAAVFADADGRRNGNQPLRANAAALVRATNRAISGTYLLINDNSAGLNTSNDLLVNINGFRGSLPGLGTITPSLVFG